MDTYLPDEIRNRPMILVCDKVLSPADAARLRADAGRGQIRVLPPSGQSRLSSAAEIAISTTVGFFLSLLIGYFIFPAMFHTNVSHETNIVVTTIFTVASVARGYLMRRFFNWLDHR